MRCHIEELLKGFFEALEDAIKEEYEIAGQVSDEEWEAIRPMKVDRRNFLLKSVKVLLLYLMSMRNLLLSISEVFGGIWRM